jgi:predicted dehydrogenase
MKTGRREFLRKSGMAGMALGLGTFISKGENRLFSDPVRIGIIGLDTSHAPDFTEVFHASNPGPGLTGFRVVAAYPHGSADIPSSVDRIPGYTRQLEQMGVEIVDSIDELLTLVDAVLLLTNDGRPHLDQARRVFKTGKPLFINKPVAGSLTDAVTIYREAAESNVPVFSASSLRYLKNAQAVRYENVVGKVLGADTYSPATLEPHHPDLFWYGIHGVEILYTIMGPGCETVTRFMTSDTDIVVGKWKDGRIGTFRGTRSGTHDYGGIAFGEKSNLSMDAFEGYQGLLVRVGEFFRNRIAPVSPAETLKFMPLWKQPTKANAGAEWLYLSMNF